MFTQKHDDQADLALKISDPARMNTHENANVAKLSYLIRAWLNLKKNDGELSKQITTSRSRRKSRIRKWR